ncbi:putative transmembrane protein [Gregarina niphandrodes]|uniref:Transmembrane protein n=1 Tax=Gregarina niphandrodes TaxID=110365 RepID=A0A023B5P3_GRENI|nr:putative transmembrane protein [Gregarina niphandrodes]EZG61401.1 putative transmembrane protein [Gregarina niphandrodes]|eukprot:XP_011130761.1 putative transmembrane protein [Gregarina niphandrodes]
MQGDDKRCQKYDPAFSDVDWWPSVHLAPPTEADVLKVVTLAGIKTRSSRIQYLTAAERLYQQQQNEILLQGFIKCLKTASEADSSDHRNKSTITTARNLCWRVLNLRVMLNAPSEGDGYAADKSRFTSMEDVPLLVMSMTILALRTLRTMLREQSLEWTFSDPQSSSRSLTLNFDQVSGSALLIPPTYSITPKEIWSIFVETMGYLGNRHIPLWLDDGLDDTCLFINFTSQGVSEVESLTKAALIDAWISLINDIGSTNIPRAFRIAPYTHCLTALMNMQQDAKSPDHEMSVVTTTSATNIIMSATSELCDNLEQSLRVIKSGRYMLTNVLHRGMWSVDFCQGVMRQMNAYLWSATATLNAADPPPQRSQHMIAAMRLCRLLSLTYDMQARVMLITLDLLNQTTRQRTPVAKHPSLAGVRQRALIPTLKTQRLTAEDGQLLVEDLLVALKKIVDGGQSERNMELNAIKRNIVALVRSGLQAIRLRIGAPHLVTCVQPLHQAAPLLATVAELNDELAHWPPAPTAAQKEPAPPAAPKQRPAGKLVAVAFALSVICITFWYLRKELNELHHWLALLPEYESVMTD